jgi:nitronate monooxygenase
VWSDRRLCDLLGIEHPLIQAPMTGTCTPALASAVSNAGGLGSLGCGEKSLDTIRLQVEEIRRLTNRSFNLNFFVVDAPETDKKVLERTRARLMPWYEKLGLGEPPTELPEYEAGFGEKQLDLVLEIKPRVVSFHFGYPDRKSIDALKNAGITLLCSATCVAEAQALEAAGMDAIIAQGWEAGGHRGSHVVTDPWQGVGTMALVPQVVDAVSVPVIAAGGIADGRGIAAALALGASGVQMGTAFLDCHETATEPARREQLRKATDSDTMVTDAFSGRCARAMKSKYALEMEQNREPLPGFVQMYALSNPIRHAAEDNDASFYLHGQAVTLTKTMGAADLLDELVAETRQSIARLRSA